MTELHRHFYLPQISPPAVRGALGSVNQLSICTGVLGALVAGLPLRCEQTEYTLPTLARSQAIGDTLILSASAEQYPLFPSPPLSSDPSLWRACFAFALVPAVLHSLLAAVYAPETPQWLVRQARDEPLACNSN